MITRAKRAKMAAALARGLPAAAVALVTCTSDVAVFEAPAMTRAHYERARELAELLRGSPRITLPRPKKKKARRAAACLSLRCMRSTRSNTICLDGH